MPREGLGRKPSKPEVAPLGKRERVLQAFAGGEVDKRPITFWHSFGLAHMKPDSLSAAALTFAAVYGLDLLRMPTVRDLPLLPQTSIDRPHDLTTLETMAPHAGFWGDRIEALKSIMRLADKRIAVFEPVPDPLTALGWVCPPEILSATERGHRSFLEKALGVVTESLKGYLKAILSEAKVDGVVLEVGSASFEAREPEDFESLIKPHLKSLADEVRAHGATPIWLHATGKRTYLEPLLDISHDMLTWSHLGHGPSLEKLPRAQRTRVTSSPGQSKDFPDRGAIRVAGGLNELAIERLSYQDIRRQVDEARNFSVAMICPGDALSADLAPSRLQALANFLSKRDRPPETAAKGRRPLEPVIDEP